MRIINNYQAVVSLPNQDWFTPHGASNVYFVALITAYAWVNLYKDTHLHLRLGEQVVYMDVDSFIYVSPSGKPLHDNKSYRTLLTWAVGGLLSAIDW